LPSAPARRPARTRLGLGPRSTVWPIGGTSIPRAIGRDGVLAGRLYRIAAKPAGSAEAGAPAGDARQRQPFTPAPDNMPQRRRLERIERALAGLKQLGERAGDAAWRDELISQVSELLVAEEALGEAARRLGTIEKTEPR
jgi:hypothetical protein